MFATETSVFGSAYLNGGPNFRQCNASGADPHINIVITNLLALLGEGGYFFGGDVITQQALNCGAPSIAPSNELPMLYIGSDFYPPGAEPTATSTTSRFGWVPT